MARPPQRLLGVDYGRVRIGIAVCDELGISITPIGFVPRSDDRSAAAVVAHLAAREEVVGLVIGLPLHAHGDAGANVRWVRAFTAHLAKVCALPIHEVDERYSSSEAEEALRTADQRMYAQKHSGRSSAGRQVSDVLVTALVERNGELGVHVRDVARMAQRVARELGLDAEQCELVARAAALHDVGKVAIPDAILQKPGSLDETEWAFVRRHTIVGERIIRAAPAMHGVADVVRSSHERWDGDGYPDALAGEDIPLGARIVAVCDAYDAMRTTRAYSAALGEEETLRELRTCSGSQFDPAVVEVFCLLRSSAPSDAVPA